MNRRDRGMEVVYSEKKSMHGKMWSVAPESRRRGDLTLAERHAAAGGNREAVYDTALDASNSAALLFAAL